MDRAERLFDVEPVTPKKPPVTPAKLAAGTPIWQVNAGTGQWYVRARDAEDAKVRWRAKHFGYRPIGVEEHEIQVRRMLHSDYCRLQEIDPKLLRRLNNL